MSDHYVEMALKGLRLLTLSRLIKITMYQSGNLFPDYNLLCTNNSGFRPSNSCEHQLHPIVFEIYKSFDCNPSKDVRGIFLDISEAYDRVWHIGLIYKIQHIRLCWCNSRPLFRAAFLCCIHKCSY